MTEEIKRYIKDGKIKHIAFIMDGNGRWAERHNMSRSEGHKAGAKVFEQIVEYCGDIGIKYVTVYAFSTENWSRPKMEVKTLMKLFSAYMDEALASLMRRKIKIVFIGDKSAFSPKMREKMIKVENDSAIFDRTLNIAFNYGSRAEIVNAVNEAIKEGKTKLTEEDIETHLYTKNSPEPDLIIRTANELRLSNFMLWQAAYSEFFFTQTLWPDMTGADVDEALESFFARKRNFGGIT